MKILITGGNGYIAQRFYTKFKDIYDITLLTRDICDLTDRVQVINFFKEQYFDAVIHTAIIGGSRLQSDDPSIVFKNISMMYNLMICRDHYKKLINIGSGAELGYPTTPYGISKSVISNIIDQCVRFYNLRVYAVFDEFELPTRFIKSSILRYKDNQDIIIYDNKLMDFYYMEDFLNHVNYYIEYDSIYTLNRSMDCCYSVKYSLLDIANKINELGSHKVNVQVISTASNYIGKYNSIPIKLVGLERGILNTYNRLL